MGSVGLEPTEGNPRDLQSLAIAAMRTPQKLSCLQDSDPRPRDYKSRALPAELKQHFCCSLFVERDVILYFSLKSVNTKNQKKLKKNHFFSNNFKYLFLITFFHEYSFSTVVAAVLIILLINFGLYIFIATTSESFAIKDN